MRRLVCVVSLTTILFTSFSASAQQTNTTVPSLIRYGGTLLRPSSATLSSKITGVTFAIYKQQEGGAPVWKETGWFSHQ